MVALWIKVLLTSCKALLGVGPGRRANPDFRIGSIVACIFRRVSLPLIPGQRWRLLKALDCGGLKDIASA